jgi:hypothetical protein
MEALIKRTDRTFVLIWLVFIAIVVCCLVVMNNQWQGKVVNPERAETLLIQSASSILGKPVQITNLEMSKPVCDNGLCRLTLKFMIDNKPATGLCVYGFGTESICAIIRFQ